MRKHFVTFLSPGTLFAEQTTKDIDEWDVETARVMAGGIEERYGATPYGFYFTTRESGPDDFDSKETARSGMYFLNGEILTIEDIRARNDPRDSILISNMEGNKWDRIVQSNRGYQWSQPLEDGDVVLGQP